MTLGYTASLKRAFRKLKAASLAIYETVTDFPTVPRAKCLVGQQLGSHLRRR